jgi:hypothetical protein
MTSIVTDFRSIARKLNRQEQKAEFEAKNKEAESSAAMYGWPYGVAVPLADQPYPVAVTMEEGGEWVPIEKFPLGEVYHSALYANGMIYDVLEGWRNPAPLKSLAHPEWPYTGTPHEWPKFKI